MDNIYPWVRLLLHVAKVRQCSTGALNFIGKSLHSNLVSAREKVDHDTFPILTLFTTNKGENKDQQYHCKQWDNDHSSFDSIGLSTEPRT